jgi:replication factor A1
MSELKHPEFVENVNDILEGVEEKEGISIDVSDTEIDESIDEYQDERIEPDEGHIYVVRKLLRTAGVSSPNEYIYNGGSGERAGGNPNLNAEEITETDRWITFEGCVIETRQPDTDGLIQTGTLADDTGTINFTIWESNGENPIDERLKRGESYQLASVVTDLFEQAGQMELNIQQVTDIGRLEGDDAFDIDPENYQETISGSVVAFKSPMGLVDKCPNGNCGRVLQQRDECPDCGDIEAELTLRTKAVLDTGEEAWTFILDETQTNEEVNLSMEDAEELVREHNDRSVVNQYIQNQLHGEYLRLYGRNYGRNFTVDEVERIDPPTIGNLDSIKEQIADLP